MSHAVTTTSGAPSRFASSIAFSVASSAVGDPSVASKIGFIGKPPWVWSRTEDDPCGHVAVQDVLHCCLHLFEWTLLADHSGLAGRVQLEDLAEVEPRADDRADDGDPVQNRLEDPQLHSVLRRQRDWRHRAA